MFSNLSIGSVLYVLDTKDDFKLSTGQITSITPPRAKLSTFNPNMYNQPAEMIVDIVATVNGEKREFRQVPSNLSIANFGADAFTITDSRESMSNHIESLYQTSKSIVDSIDKNKATMEHCKRIRVELNPSLAAEVQRDTAMTNLETKVDNLSKQFEELMSVLKSDNTKTIEQ